MSTQKDKLLARRARAQQTLHKADMEEQNLNKQIDELPRRERAHCFCTHGAYPEKILQELGLLTDEDVFQFLDCALNTPYAKKALEKLLATNHQEADTAEKNEAGKLTD